MFKFNDSDIVGLIEKSEYAAVPMMGKKYS